MPPRIAIPEPTSDDPEYNARALPQYVAAVEKSGAEPVVIHLNDARERIGQLLEGIDGVLLPGSGHDVDPALYGETSQPETASNDPARAVADHLLLEDAFSHRKPLLAICHGTQTLNVWRGGSLIQDLKTGVNHRPGREVVNAHPVKLASESRLQKILSITRDQEPHVNSSHHQAIRTPGKNLRVTALSPIDNIVEAIELVPLNTHSANPAPPAANSENPSAPDHFVVGVQWHPERTYEQSEFSRAIFSAFVAAADDWQRISRPPNALSS